MFSPIKLIWRRALFSRVDGALYILWQDQLSSMGFTDTPRDERRISLGRKILVSSFYLFLVLYYLMLSGNFYGSKTRHGIFWGLNYGPCIFFFFFEAQGVLLGFDFCPIRSSLSLEIRSTPPPPPPPRADTPDRSLRYRGPFSCLLALHSGSASCDDTKNGLLRRHCLCATKAEIGSRKLEVGSGKWEV